VLTLILYLVGCMAVHKHGEDMGWPDVDGAPCGTPGFLGWAIVALWPIVVPAAQLMDVLRGGDDDDARPA